MNPLSVEYMWPSFINDIDHLYAKQVLFVRSLSQDYFLSFTSAISFSYRNSIWESFIVDLMEIKPGGSGGWSAVVRGQRTTWRCWVPGVGAGLLTECLFAPTDCGEVLLFIFLRVETWFFFFLYFVISDFSLAVYCEHQRRYYETGKSYICVINSASYGHSQDVVSGRRGPVPFPKSRKPMPVDRVNLIGLTFWVPRHPDEACSDASVTCLGHVHHRNVRSLRVNKG